MPSTLHLQGGSQCYNPFVYILFDGEFHNGILSWGFAVYNSNGSLIFSDFGAQDGGENSK